MTRRSCSARCRVSTSRAPAARPRRSRSSRPGASSRPAVHVRDPAPPPRVAVDGFATGQGLFHALDYRPREAVWTGPLALLVDRYTASASEYFASLLRDNEAAVLVGETTLGVGCGYTNGGIQTLLPASGLELWMPDCVRHRRDGGNERAGLEPDLAVAWASDDTREARGVELRRGLARWAPWASMEAGSR